VPPTATLRPPPPCTRAPGGIAAKSAVTRPLHESDVSAPSLPPGFWAGAASVFRGVAFLFRTPAAWLPAMVPATVLLAFTAVFVWLSVSQVEPLVASWLPSPREWYAKLGVEFLSWLAAALAALLGFVLALAVTPPLSSPALEKVVALRERDLGVPERPPLGFWQEVWCGLKAQVSVALLAGPVLVLLWLLDLLFPIAAVVTVPIKCVVVSAALAWNLFDYPLTLRGVRMRGRLALINAHWRPTLGFGLAFSVLFWIPCSSVLLLPVGVVAATEVVWGILRSDPRCAARLPAGTPARPPAPTGDTRRSG
jgi:CysZ protein